MMRVATSLLVDLLYMRALAAYVEQRHACQRPVAFAAPSRRAS